MAIINQLDKRTGTTYVYESTSYWDKEKKQARSKRTLIGKRDPNTWEIIPTDGRGKKRKDTSFLSSERLPPGPVPIQEAKRVFYGATYLLDEISRHTGLAEDLKQCFPSIHKQLLSIAYYLVLEQDSSLFRFERWHSFHYHPYGKVIPSQRSSELFASVSEQAKQAFFQLQRNRQVENEYWAYDTTSISSYSQTLKQVQYGKNKEDDRLPQLNVALLFGQTSGLPFYYRKLAGNIPDMKTLQTLLGDLHALDFDNIKLVMDRGFYSRANIDALLKERLKFVIATKTSLSYVRLEIDQVETTIRSYECLHEQYNLYMKTTRFEWDYQQERPYKKDTLTEKRRMYLHIYLNLDKRAEDEMAFDRKLLERRREILEKRRKPEHERYYRTYFHIKETPKRGPQVDVNMEEVEKARRYFGYFTLLTNEKMTAEEALCIYRNKDLVEKGFGNMKDRLNMRRLLVSSEKSLDGKLFVSFIALILTSYIKKRMEEAGLYKHHTMQSLLDQLDTIECFEHPGYKRRVGEVLSKQEALYNALGITPPT